MGYVVRGRPPEVRAEHREPTPLFAQHFDRQRAVVVSRVRALSHNGDHTMVFAVYSPSGLIVEMGAPILVA